MTLEEHARAASEGARASLEVGLLSVGFDRHLHVWDVNAGTETKKIGPTPDDLYGVAFSRDGKEVATIGYGGNVTVWNGFTTCWFSAGLHDPTYIPAIVTSLQIAAVASVIATALGLCAALALARMRQRFRAPFDVLVYLTLVVPEIVIAVASLIFFVQVRNHFHLFPPLGRGTILIGQRE